MEGLGTVEIIRSLRPGRKGRVGGDLLRRGRARKQAQDGRGVFQRRHHLLDAGDYDVDFGQGLGQIAVAFIGDDHGRPGLGDEEIRAGDTHIGLDKPVAQHRPRFVQQILGLVEPPGRVETRVSVAEGVGDLLYVQMNRRGGDVAWRLAAQLKDVLAEIGLDGGDAVGLEEGVKPYLLRDHRLALGDGPRPDIPAQGEHRVTRFLGRAAPVDVAAIGRHLFLERLEIEIEILEHVILDRLGLVPEGVEFGQSGDHLGALGAELMAHFAERAALGGILQRPVGAFLEGVADRFHHLSLSRRRRVRRWRGPRPCRRALPRCGAPAPANRSAGACRQYSRDIRDLRRARSQPRSPRFH